MDFPISLSLSALVYTNWLFTSFNDGIFDDFLLIKLIGGIIQILQFVAETLISEIKDLPLNLIRQHLQSNLI